MDVHEQEYGGDWGYMESKARPPPKRIELDVTQKSYTYRQCEEV